MVLAENAEQLTGPVGRRMDLRDIIERKIPPDPWEEGEKIPWNDPAFSERILATHLSQESDWASRREAVVDRHVDWIGKRFLDGPSSILDLACGPGLYARRLAARGHRCVGIDFGPASIRHAREEAAAAGLEIAYHLADVREAEFGENFDLVMMVFGEFGVFRREEAFDILCRARAALAPGGRVLVEVATCEEIERQGKEPPWWQALERGLFSDRPHLWLEEHFWREEAAATVSRWLIVDAESGETTRYASTTQAYRPAELRGMLGRAGFEKISFHKDMGEKETEFAGKLLAVSARNPGR